MQAVASPVGGACDALPLNRPRPVRRLVDAEDEWLTNADETERRELLMEVSFSVHARPLQIPDTPCWILHAQSHGVR